MQALNYNLISTDIENVMNMIYKLTSKGTDRFGGNVTSIFRLTAELSLKQKRTQRKSTIGKKGKYYNYSQTIEYSKFKKKRHFNSILKKRYINAWKTFLLKYKKWMNRNTGILETG